MNRQTKRLNDLGLSLKFNHGYDFSHGNRGGEFTIVSKPSSKGRTVDSGKERQRKPYNPIRMEKHPYVERLKQFSR